MITHGLSSIYIICIQLEISLLFLFTSQLVTQRLNKYKQINKIGVNKKKVDNSILQTIIAFIL